MNKQKSQHWNCRSFGINKDSTYIKGQIPLQCTTPSLILTPSIPSLWAVFPHLLLLVTCHFPPKLTWWKLPWPQHCLKQSVTLHTESAFQFCTVLPIYKKGKLMVWLFFNFKAMGLSRWSWLVKIKMYFKMPHHIQLVMMILGLAFRGWYRGSEVVKILLKAC